MKKILLFVFFQMFFISSVLAGDFYIDGVVGGRIEETKNSIVIKGANIVLNGGDGGAIEIDKKIKKKVFITNTRIISNNQRISDSTGVAGVVAIDNSNSKSRVTLKNVKVIARNNTVVSASDAKDVCAGIVCNKAGVSDTSTSVTVFAVGTTNISATQGIRPDYRKIKN